MQIFGLFITTSKKAAQSLQAVSDRGTSWWPIVRESFTGAWQRGVEVRTDTVLTYGAVYSCINRIKSDIGKLRPKLVEQDKKTGIWSEVTSPAFSPVLVKPNHFQTRIQFYEHWITSKLIHGNAYILKVRDNRQVVTDLYVLDPTRTKPLVSALDGSVFYELSKDNLSGLTENITVPASEIIHDTMNPLYHPLVGVSPISACGLAAMQGIRIQNNSANFFGNSSIPSGVLSAPAAINNATAQRIKETWETNFTAANFGKIAVLGDGLKYEAMGMKAVDAQLIEQLKWTAENVCTAFAVPAYMVGVGAAPTYNNIEALNQQYYSQCLQILIESLELLLDEGLGLVNAKDHIYGVEFDLDGLLRMDTATQYKTLGDGIGAGLIAPNEARAKIDLHPVPGGDTPYLQMQNFSLAALDKRDASADPFKSNSATPPAVPAAPAKQIEDLRTEDVDDVEPDWDEIRTEMYPEAVPALLLEHRPAT